MAFDIEMIKAVYSKMEERITAARKVVNKPLTLTEKILYSHLTEGNANTSYERGKSYVDFGPDRLPCKMQQLKWRYCNLCNLADQQWLFLLLFIAII
jgi:hypothetical protein